MSFEVKCINYSMLVYVYILQPFNVSKMLFGPLDIIQKCLTSGVNDVYSQQ